MNPMNERDIENLLTHDDKVEPPADLADRIKAEIPAEIHFTEAPPAAPRRNYWPLAAALVMLIGGGLLTQHLLQAPLSPTPSKPPAQVATTAVESQPTDASPAVGDAVNVDAVAPTSPTPSNEGGDPAETLRFAQDQLAEKLSSLKQTEPPAPTTPAPQVQLPQTARRSADPTPSAIELPPADAFVFSIPPQAETEAAPAEAAPAQAPPPPARPLRTLPPPRAKQGPTPARSQPPVAKPSRSRPHSQMVEHDSSGSYLPPPAPPGPHVTPQPIVPRPVDPRPFDELHFKDYGTNPFLDTEDDHLSTFGLDVDTGSYTVVRNFLERGVLPPQEAVRVEEMVNYFDYRDASPRRGDFALGGEAAPSPFAHGERYYLMRLHVAAREVAEHQRPPAQLVFVVDVSGSMNRENRLGLVRQALHLLVDRLRPDDTIGLVVYGSRGEVVLHPTSDKNAIRNALDRLRPSGSTNAEEGLVLAYELAERYRRPDAIQRLILCSDGVANVGAANAADILESVARRAEEGIELTTVGFGMGNYNDVLMEQLADQGDGRYAYVDSLDEAHRIFVEDLTGTLFTVASEARVQVDFDPEHVARYRLLGYENRDIADHRFRDDTVDAGEIGAGHRVTALYEIKLRDDLPHRRSRRDNVHLATLHLRYLSEASGQVEELAHDITGGDLMEQLELASPALRLSAVVAETAEVLRGSYWARGSNLDNVFRRAQQISREFEGDREVAEFVYLVGKAASTMERERGHR